jgi:NAD(P)-dependent dehydrogenase (short-subunit alcohol dehydrogenase family)
MAPWKAENMPPQNGKVFIVTGPTGLGYETGLALAKASGRVILAGRTPDKGEAAAAKIRAAAPNADVRFELCDLASLASIRAFAERINASDLPVDCLINNAGVMAYPERRETADGFEAQFGTNHLGHFALTGLLLPALRKVKRPRVVTVSSLAGRFGKMNFDDLNYTRGYNPGLVYAQSKLANMLFATELQRRSNTASWGLLSIAAHPGVSATELVRSGPGSKSYYLFAEKFMSQSAAMGALPQLYAATESDAAGGAFYGPKGLFEMRGYPGEVKFAPAALDDPQCLRLWKESEKLTGVTYTP